jgi:hypothetical protein
MSRPKTRMTSDTLELKSVGKAKPRLRGLGDMISHFLALFAIKPCEACRRRAEVLNGLVPFERRSN